MKKIFFTVFLLIFLFFTIINSANEVEIFADSIEYDSDDNITAKGNVKIIDGDEILTSSIVIINQKKNIFFLPKEFQYKDRKDNYYNGSSGEFSTDFENAIIYDLKMLLNDGSRIIGKKAIKTGKQDLIEKGVYSPCKSKIKIKNFICPIWQVEGEKIFHDRDKLFIYTKHAKTKIFNTPVYYFPYMVAPSPLRKERKSGFLNPSIAFNFLSTKVEQQLSFPYYFAIDLDKELLITPTINYGGGVDSSQIITYKYNQSISGGQLSINASSDTNLENQNNESWLRDASIILKLNQNLNENYNMSLSSAFQTSPTYLRRTDQNNLLNRKSTLATTFNLNGYEVLEQNDTLAFTIAGYQVVRNNEDNKTTPTSFPYVKYVSGVRDYKGNRYKNNLTAYNIFRDISTTDHAQQQQKIEYALKSDEEFYSLYSKLNFKTELYTQLYNIENKENDNDNFSGNYSRFFPMTGIYFETPMVNKKYNLYITPKFFGVFNSSQSNSNKISNEDSTDYQYDLNYYDDLNRYTGTDKLDNSKRLGYGLNINKNQYSLDLGQTYEVDLKRNDFANNAGLYNHVSDLLGSAQYNGDNNDLIYGFRFNVDQGLMKSSTGTFKSKNILGKFNLHYSQARKEINKILETETETLDLKYKSNEFFNYSSVSASATFDLIKDDPTNYLFGYQYIDECFAINLDFERSFYEDRDLKPKDMLTLMFSFKYLGSYASTNLAVDHMQRQNIKWKTSSVDEKLFK